MASSYSAACACGKVQVELLGGPIFSAICHCDDCQSAGRQLSHLDGSEPVTDAYGGTPYVLFRKDRVRYGKGEHLLVAQRLKPDSATKRMVASCCNTPVLVDFDSGPHWVSVYATAMGGLAPALDYRIQTRFQPEDLPLPHDMPEYRILPLAMLGGLLGSRLGMVLGQGRRA